VDFNPRLQDHNLLELRSCEVNVWVCLVLHDFYLTTERGSIRGIALPSVPAGHRRLQGLCCNAASKTQLQPLNAEYRHPNNNAGCNPVWRITPDSQTPEEFPIYTLRPACEVCSMPYSSFVALLMLLPRPLKIPHNERGVFEEKKGVFAQVSKCHFATKNGFLLTLGFINYT
jgi:hypothetical protein